MTDDPRSVFAAALTQLRRRRADLSDEALARRASRTALPSGRHAAVNARRLGEWVSGQSVPRDFDGLMALVLALDPGAAVAPWQRLWRAAYDHRTAPRPTDPPVEQAHDVVVGHPPTDAAGLCDRAALATAVDTALGGDGVRRVVLRGTGGVGKTQLASAAFHRTRGRGAVLVWTAAGTPESVRATYARAWRALSREGRAQPDGPGGDDDTQADLFIAWLRTAERPWLVVLDDVDDPAALDGLWPIGPAGRALVTTRRRDAALTGPAVEVVEVGMFTPQESTGYLRARLGDAADGHVAALAGALGHYPLALSQAAAFVIDSGIGVEAYLGLLADRRETVGELFPPTSPADGHDGTVAETWQLALDRAAALVPPGHARAMLDLLSLLAADDIPDVVPRSAAARAWLAGAGTPAEPVSERAALLALRALHRLSLVVHDPARGPVSVAVHPLVQRATRETAAAPGAVAVAAADAVEECWARARDQETAGALFRCADTLDALAGEHLWSGGMHPVLRRLGGHLSDSGRPGAARDRDTLLLATALDRLGQRHRDVLVLRARVAASTGRLGDAATACDALADLGRTAVEALGPDDPDTLCILSDAAYWRLESGAGAAALEELRALLPRMERVLGPLAPATLDAYRHTALGIGHTGDAAGARDAYAAYAARLEAAAGTGHPAYYPNLADLGRWTGEAGDPEGAVAVHRRAAAGLEATRGPLDEETLTCRHNLAYWEGLAGRPDAAAGGLAVVVADAVRGMGAEHPLTLTARANHAYWQGMAGAPGPAVAALDAVLADIERTMGVEHPRALRTRQHRAQLRALAGDRSAAITELRAVLDRMTTVQGAGHPRTREVGDLLATLTTAPE
ncbi:ATP-binding protein [Dactylosporangium aurantiacum]|uniref:ATP-binding protein n=1 Tax=Dactylosporangium aurantiacum TaxID=35754 RepID=A0A9Q9M9M3_9ACTN|nr:NB-ARC domain-containing protein [Dactylosporangium aurantiacum]MDG6106740.1 NB-ARC domain-containing protein [Dactylosporangium aurantiacum]UWZ50888.1 ATP-binding protein [Dactylosporangium aurantiacum]